MTTPVFFVNHSESPWSSLHRELLSNPTIACNDEVSREVNKECMSELPTLLGRTIPSNDLHSTNSHVPNRMSHLLNTRPPQHVTQLHPNCCWHVVSALGFPFLVLLTIPGVPLGSGVELIADRGEEWQRQQLLNQCIAKSQISIIGFIMNNFISDSIKSL